MAASLSPVINTYLADAAITAYYAVKIGTDKSHVAVGAANTDKCIGIAQCAATGAEKAVEVAMPGGGAKAKLGEAVSAGAYLVSHTDGTLMKANAAGDHVCAVALEAGDSGDIINVAVCMFEAYNAE
jgi:hypothetical protein